MGFVEKAAPWAVGCVLVVLIFKHHEFGPFRHTRPSRPSRRPRSSNSSNSNRPPSTREQGGDVIREGEARGREAQKKNLLKRHAAWASERGNRCVVCMVQSAWWWRFMFILFISGFLAGATTWLQSLRLSWTRET
ncbi:hypothetical protein DUNSADRAFT_12760 [Dunaliella salina]|uniref:Encoded protein n=1 Tax=Dunaliella salina TaxID=3046 RepID=A0ABQ7GAN5_DUNSA|nr:hypothetical protein DUNSADRAFT_12760 [Dunaliella salina]|eukprot:KAF5831655.1 hypothetical protein DUNSADRAFT_12760 [Dunaliella salina]